MTRSTLIAAILAMLLSGTPAVDADTGEASKPAVPETAGGDFTGEILPVFYVSDSTDSVAFYEKLGFRVNHYHDYDTGETVETWAKESQPIYIEMGAGERKFALHLIGEDDTLAVDGMKHYFGVSDVDAHHRLVTGNGIETSELYDRPWMRMFYVEDPDGHRLYFFTRPEEQD